MINKRASVVGGLKGGVHRRPSTNNINLYVVESPDIVVFIFYHYHDVALIEDVPQASVAPINHTVQSSYSLTHTL